MSGLDREIAPMVADELRRYMPNLVEVVRCEECKHWWSSEEICDRKRTITSGSWFCADGERREDETD